MRHLKNIYMKVILDFIIELCYNTFRSLKRQQDCVVFPGVAQIGSALEWGSRGRRFDSCHSDHTECPYGTYKMF